MPRVPLSLSHGARATCALASLVLSGTVAAALLGAFHGASPARWLRPSPELMEMAALCQEQPARGERVQCTRRVIAARLARETGSTVMAQTRPPGGH